MAFDREMAGRIVKNKEYGNRIVFVDGPTNPRDELGKNGVNYHNWFTALFRKTIKIRMQIINEDEDVDERVVRFNRNSLVSYALSLPNFNLQIEHAKSDHVLTSELRNYLHQQQISRGQALFEEGNHLRHAGKHNQRPILSWRHAFGDFVRGNFFGWLYQATISSLRRLRARFLFASTERKYFDVSETLAKRRFNEAAEKVPAYQQHLAADNNFQTKSEKKFSDIPVTSKKNYITKNSENDWDLHMRGKYPSRQKVDTSTGTTGKPTVWSRGEAEVDTVKKSLQVAVEIESGDRRLHYIDAFALGPWATGMTAFELMRATGSVFASGPDNEKIIDELERVYKYEQHLISEAVSRYISQHGFTLSERYPQHSKAKKELMMKFVNDVLNAFLDDKNLDARQAIKRISDDVNYANYQGKDIAFVKDADFRKMIEKLNKEKSQIVIAGYPPYLKDLVDKANARGLNFAKYHARGIVGGQAISEALREKLIEAGFSRINSSYGASDCDINLAVETDYEIGLRKILEKHPEIARELYGAHRSVPMVFHYDPFNYHVEVDAEDELIFTCNRNDRSSPRVRYDLGDKGRVFAVSDVQAILAKHGIYDHAPKINLPLVFVWGRDSAVSYRGSKVAFTDLERAITTVDKENNFVKRAFYSYEDETGQEQFEIWTELKEGVALPSQAESEEFLRRLLVEMGKQNQDFRSHLDANDTAKLPALRIYTKGNSPIANSDGVRKQVLVYKPSSLSEADKAERAADALSRVAIAKDDLFRAAMATRSAKTAGTNGNYGPGSSRLLTLPSTAPAVAAAQPASLHQTSAQRVVAH